MSRLIDVVLAFGGVVVFAPVFVVVALLVSFKLGAPILFQQTRPGKHGKLFKLFKFRTMKDLRSNTGELLPDKQRLSSFGRLLRSTSLDELPSLINVLKGDMSLVGPRPLLVEYLDRYTPEQARRHEVRPGITGWAQVNGRNAISWDEKFDLDIWYVDNQSFLLNLKILVMTIKKIFMRDGITAHDHVTTEKFRGK